MFASWWEWGVVLLVIVLLFGTKRLPELGSGLGKAISNFRKSYRGENVDSDTSEAKTEAKKE